MIKSTIPKRGPPPALPKKVDYKNPQMTKAMLQRLKHAQKFQEELERKDQERGASHAGRKPRRSMGPSCGDPRAGRDRRPNTAEVASPNTGTGSKTRPYSR
jgi:hypothetical protein